MSIVNFRNFIPGVKLLSPYLIRRIKISLKSNNLHESLELRHFWRRVIFVWYKFGGGGGGSTYESVSFCNDYRVSDILV